MVVNPYRNLAWLFLLALLIALVGCEANNDVEYACPKLDIKFAPSAAQQTLNITRIEITIKGSNPESIEVPVKPGQRHLDLSFLIPLDATGISVEAYEVDENDQERLALKGEEPIGDLTRTAPEITVWLYPVTAHLRLKTPKTDLRTDELFTIEISVVNVTNLFSMALEFEFNSRLLEPISVSAGALFGEDSIVFDDLGLSGPADRLSIAVALTGGNAGITDSGVAAEVRFRAKAAGSATISVVGQTGSEVFVLQQPSGELISDFDRLKEFLTRAEVTVNIR